MGAQILLTVLRKRSARWGADVPIFVIPAKPAKRARAGDPGLNPHAAVRRKRPRQASTRWV